MSEFFHEVLEQSQIKATIVEKYFGAWSTIMCKKSKSAKIGYIDLFSGPGRYDDGTESTPLKILQQCIDKPVLREKIVTIFNDANTEYIERLQREINSIRGIENLKNKPILMNTQIGQEIVDNLKSLSMVPCISFIDPWGYKGLSSNLIEALIKDWGSDCIFFFNYNRINMGITNPIVVPHINAIFGEARANNLRSKVKGLNPNEREQTIINELAEAVSNGDRNYVLPFKFVRADRASTSHYLIFISKSTIGYEIMKDIMWKYSSDYDDNVANFSYIPVENTQLNFLYSFSKPLDKLGEELMRKFAGKTLSVKEVYQRHNIGTRFVLSNYKETLRRLEEHNKIIVDPPASERPVRKGIRTMSENVIIRFP